MDTPVEEQNKFNHVTHLITLTADEVVSPGSLSVDVIEQVCPFHFPKFSGQCDFYNFLLQYCCNFDNM